MMKEGKVDCNFWLSAEAVKALTRMVELTGVTQASIIEMALVAMLVGFTNNPYYEQLINQPETMREIRNRYPAQLSKFSFVLVSKYTRLCLPPFPKTISSFVSKSISALFMRTSSPTLIPVEDNNSINARSRIDPQCSLRFSTISSVYASFTNLRDLIL